MQDFEQIKQLCARVLAVAVLRVFPNSKLGEGGCNQNGFYFDFQLSLPIREEDLKKLTVEMQEVVSSKLRVEKSALLQFSDQPFKLEQLRLQTYLKPFKLVNQKGEVLLEDLSDFAWSQEEVIVKHFKLTKISGAFFMGDSNNPQLTRISGVVGRNAQDLAAILKALEEQKNRDHKIIGRKLGVFTMNHFFGQGFMGWLEEGTKIKNKIENVVRDYEKRFGFDEVSTPIFGIQELYITSGHWEHYQNTMFPPIKLEHENLVLRPMTCPHHIILFKSRKWSYRELPKRFSEHSQLFRKEASGALSGLERVRAMELTDGHIFLRLTQINSEIKRCFQMIEAILKEFGIQIDHLALSTRDKNNPDKFTPNDELWETTERLLRECVQSLGVPFIEEAGEAAFYGPKLDIQIKNFLDKTLTISTIQLDFLLPERFDVTYINKEGQKQKCVMIHRGLIGTYERFISILLEQYQGFLPFWLTPRQVVIIPIVINEPKLLEYAQTLFEELKQCGLEVVLDLSEERFGKKILKSQTRRFHFSMIVGKKEMESKTVAVRAYGEEKSQTFNFQDFKEKLLWKNENRQ